MNNRKVVIIGSGLAGYVAALFLAKKKIPVLLVEQAKSVGGRAKTDILKDQFFNLGPHAFYIKGKAPSILKELGIELEGKSPKLNGLLMEKDEKHALPLSLGGVFSTSFLNMKEKIEWASFLVKITKIDVSAVKEQSFQQWLEGRVKSTKVQQLVYTLSRLATYSHAPDQTDAKVILTHIQRSLGGAIYIDGGWQSVIDQLNNQAVMAGVQIQTGTKVKNVTLQEEGLYTLQLSNGENVTSENVIYTGKPGSLPKIFQPEFHEKSYYSKMKPITGAVLDIALNQLPKPKNLIALSVDDAFYYSVHSPYARLSKEDNSAVIHVMKYHQPNEVIDAEKEKMDLEHFLDRLQPRWRSALITSRYLPHIVVNQRLPLPGDAKVLSKSETSLPGFFIAGDWASPDSILAEGAVSSGKQAALELLRKGD